MHLDVYKSYEDRPRLDPKGFEEELYVALRRLSRACRLNVLVLDEKLAITDPDIDERCGLMAGRFEVFAMRIEQCSAWRFAVSIDIGGTMPPPVTRHGPVPAEDACEAARRLTRLHRGLIDPAWET